MAREQAVGRWGTWGDDDERGAFNLLGEAGSLAAVGLVTRGRAFSLAIPIRHGGPFTGSKFRNGLVHVMRVDGGDYIKPPPGAICSADDYVIMSTHGCTHLDALCHVWSDGLMYNGHSSRSVRSNGARKLGIQTLGPVVTRGVMIDVPRLLGVDALEAGFVITPAHVESALRAQGDLQVNSGDAVLFRTGWIERFDDLGPAAFEGSRPGIGRAVGEWAVDVGAVLLGADTGSVEVVPSEDGSPMPLHLELIRNQGLPLLELMYLAELSEAEVYEFLFVANPLPVVGGTAGPIAPVAIV